MSNVPTIPTTRRTLAVAATAAAALLGSVGLVGCGSSDSSTNASDTATTTTAASSTTKADTSTTAKPDATTTTAPATTTTSGPRPITEQPATAIWPFVSSDIRFTKPEDAAESFATGYIGFTDPSVGSFQALTATTGTVAIRPRPDGPTTTIALSKLADDSWWATGATTQNIDLQSPKAGETIASPVTVSGQSTAFEATVNAQIRQDGSTDALVDTFVMGGANGEIGPFSKPIAFNTPTQGHGAIVLRTDSAMDGSAEEANVVRVAFPA